MLESKNFENVSILMHGHEVIISRSDQLDTTGFEVFFPNEIASNIYDSLILSGDPNRIKLIGEKAFELARVQAKIPKWGNEITKDYNPLEANLLEMISWTKGCYIGQEVVARLHNYEKVKQHLVGFSVPMVGNISPGDRIISNDRNVGTITSAVSIPGSEKTIAMGYIRANFVNTPTDLCLSSGLRIDIND